MAGGDQKPVEPVSFRDLQTVFPTVDGWTMGKPTGDPVARIAYQDVTGFELTSGKASMQADLDLADGRHLAFEIQSRGTGKPSIGVVELMKERCVLA